MKFHFPSQKTTSVSSLDKGFFPALGDSAFPKKGMSTPGVGSGNLVGNWILGIGYGVRELDVFRLKNAYYLLCLLILS